jgi:hypothetical protein
MGEKIVGFLDIVELHAVGDKGRQVDPVRRNDLHKAAHPFFPARAQRCDDHVFPKARGKGIERYPKVARINAEA